MSSAALSHEKSRARSLPFAINDSRTFSSSISVMPSAMEASLNGSTSKAASSATSGIEVTLEVMTGVSHLNASKIGMPKPSKYETYTEAKAEAVTR